MVSSAQATGLTFFSTVSDFPGSTQENRGKVESVSHDVFARFHGQIGQQVGGHPSRKLAGSVHPISDSSKDQGDGIDYSQYDPNSIVTIDYAPRSDVEADDNYPTRPDAYPFLSRFIVECHPKRSHWAHIADLKDVREEVQKFYEQELQLRDQRTILPLETFKGWELAEKSLQKFDLENLKKIMERLVPILQRIGYLNTLEKETSPFAVLREITCRPEIVKKAKELDFSNCGLSRTIPPSFYRIIFPSVERLSLSGNQLLSLPPDIQETFPLRRTLSFFSKYPALQELDLSQCGLAEFSDELFSNLPHLRKLNLSGNWLTCVPEQFGITDDHRAKEVHIDLSGNQWITRIEEATLQYLAIAKSVRVYLNLRGSLISATGYSAPPENVVLLFDPYADPGYRNATVSHEQVSPKREAGQRRGTFKRGDIPGVLELDEAKTAEASNSIPKKEEERYVDAPWSFNPDEVPS